MNSLYEKFSQEHWQTLTKRAQRVQQAAQQIETRQLVEILTVQLGDENYAIPIKDIRAVYEDIAVTEIPGVPGHIAGIANIRGQLVTVLDLASILEVELDSEQFSLVMLDAKDMNVVVSVQTVKEVTEFVANELKPLPDGHKALFIQGVMSDGTAVLDIAKIIADESLNVDQQQ